MALRLRGHLRRRAAGYLGTLGFFGMFVINSLKFFVMRVSVCVTKYTAKIGATHPAHARPGAALVWCAASFGFAKGKTGVCVYIATVGTATPLRSH